MHNASALKHTKDVLIKNLRGYLRNYDNYKRMCPKDFSHTQIFDKEPNELRAFPIVILTGSSGQMITAGISADFAMELRDENGDLRGYRYGGMYEFSITVEIGTRSTLDRERLTDLTSMAYRFHLRRFMEKEGILIKDMRYGGESEVPYDSDKIYVSTIQFTTWSEWYRDYDLLDIEDIDVSMGDQEIILKHD
jgi:hypothetical protein